MARITLTRKQKEALSYYGPHEAGIMEQHTLKENEIQALKQKLKKAKETIQTLAGMVWPSANQGEIDKELKNL